MTVQVKMKKLLTFLFLTPVFFSPVCVSPVFADGRCGDSCPPLCTAPNTSCVATVCECDTGYVCTGLGCIATDPEGLVFWFLTFAIKIAGGMALLLLAYGGIKFITSKGDPKALDEAKSTITSALSGLFLIIFSVLFLKIIGYDILRIPGWDYVGRVLKFPH